LVGKGTLVAVGGSAVAVGAMVGGKAVAVGGKAVAVAVGAITVAVGATTVAVGGIGTAVAVGGTTVGVSVGIGVALYRHICWNPSEVGVISQSNACANAAAGKSNAINTITGTNIRFVMVILIVHRENKS